MNTARSVIERARNKPRRSLEDAIKEMAEVVHPGDPDSQARFIRLQTQVFAKPAARPTER